MRAAPPPPPCSASAFRRLPPRPQPLPNTCLYPPLPLSAASPPAASRCLSVPWVTTPDASSPSCAPCFRPFALVAEPPSPPATTPRRARAPARVSHVVGELWRAPVASQGPRPALTPPGWYIRTGIPPAMVFGSGVCAKRIVVDTATTCSAAYPRSLPRSCSTTKRS
ncbi:mucin-7-like [Panicum hallii]|uniref:mucin-7-like n=1 Tax=Panicum hallii TaxID=206008 RepID=UPI000DF4ED23|nr:mucin-7-like [Panicum hallii]